MSRKKMLSYWGDEWTEGEALEHVQTNCDPGFKVQILEYEYKKNFHTFTVKYIRKKDEEV
jgi:hypothetical protein